jgi:oligopeptide transport system substrate-binding protein
MKFSQIILIFFTSFFFFACSNNPDSSDKERKADEKPVYGGVFKMPLTSYFLCNQVNEIQKLETGQIYQQIFEGLVKYDPQTMEILPSLAKDWEISEDGLKYTFQLRDSVYFHDATCFVKGKGRMVTGRDVQYSFERIYHKDTEGNGYSVFANIIEGGEAFRNGSSETISGISVDGQSVTFTLIEPSLTFLQKVASIYAVIISKEATEAEYFVPVGTGPFYYDFEHSNSIIVTLGKFDRYYGVDEYGGKLPYLDSIYFIYQDNTDDQMNLFWEHELSYIPEVPITKISEVLEEKIKYFKGDSAKYILKSQPQLITTYLELNMQTPVLQDKKVRQALNYAIDRNKIMNQIMKDQAYEVGKFGIVPPIGKIFQGYDFSAVENRYPYNPDSARALLAEAGYPDGKDFPTIQFQFRLGSIDYLVASEIQRQVLSVLNINLDIEGVEFNKLLENKVNGKGDIFRTNWVADYPSPEAFLSKAYGKLVPEDTTLPAYLNSSRYQNPAYDVLFEKAKMADNLQEANAYYQQAESVLLDDAAFIILWYAEDLILQQGNLRNLETNGISYLDLKHVFISKSTAEDKKDISMNEGGKN